MGKKVLARFRKDVENSAVQYRVYRAKTTFKCDSSPNTRKKIHAVLSGTTKHAKSGPAGASPALSIYLIRVIREQGSITLIPALF